MIASILGIAFGITSCGLDIPKETPSSFETIVVKKTDVELPMKFSAKLKGQSDVTITPQVSGQLMRICVTEGQRVNRGQVLFVIDSRNAQHEVEAARANLQAAQANLSAAQAQANSAKLEYESNKNLFDKKIVSSYMLENSRNSYNQATAAVSQAKAAVTQAQSSVNRARVNLGFCTITAPVTGVIGEIPVRTGDQVSPATYLTILSGNTTMDAEFSVSEAIIEAQVQAGMKGDEKEKHMAALPDVTFVMKNGTEYKSSVLGRSGHRGAPLPAEGRDGDSAERRGAPAGQVACIQGEGRQHGHGRYGDHHLCRQR